MSFSTHSRVPPDVNTARNLSLAQESPSSWLGRGQSGRAHFYAASPVGAAAAGCLPLVSASPMRSQGQNPALWLVA
jgi:hypothetical protein